MTMRTFVDTNRINDALRNATPHVDRTGPMVWQIALQNGKRVEARATLSGPWFTLCTPVHQDPVFTPWRLLTLNASLPAGARITLDPRDLSPALRVDAYLGVERDEDARVGEACSALLASASILINHDATRPDVPPNSDEFTSIAERLVSDLAWPYAVLDDGSYRFDFDSRSERLHALLTNESGTTRCCVHLVARPALTERSREATAVALLTGGRAMHLVRATGVSDDNGDRIGFEVRLPRSAVCADVDLTLGALMSACEQLGRETRALTDPTMAAAYLAAVMPHELPLQRG